MEHDIHFIKNKLSLMIFWCLLLVIFLFNSCERYPRIVYQLSDTNGKKLTSVSRDITSYNELINKGSVLYFEFTQVGNRKYNQISISLYTLKKYNTLKIHELEFEFEEHVKVINLNKSYKLKQTPKLFFVEGNFDMNKEAFYYYIFYDYNSTRLYLQEIFEKKDNDIGQSIDLNLILKYSYDDGEILTQELKYIVTIYKGRPDRPEWMYRFFPEI